jgi:hypothetical protein
MKSYIEQLEEALSEFPTDALYLSTRAGTDSMKAAHINQIVIWRETHSDAIDMAKEAQE